MLAPIAGYTDLAFREVVRSANDSDNNDALGLAWTALVSCQAIVRHRADPNHHLWRTSQNDKPLAVQIHGCHPETMAQAAKYAEQQGADLIDINMGCPADTITRHSGGADLLRQPKLAALIARHVVRAVAVPVTVKLRTGWNCRSIITDSLPVALANEGVNAVIIHGRTAEQRYTGRVDLDRIAQVVSSLSSFHNVTVIGNGDIRKPEEAKHMLDYTRCHGVMIGRGALGRPWLFRDTAYYLRFGRMAPDLTLDRKLVLIQAHLNKIIRYREPQLALYHFKKRIKWYSPHLQPWPGFKKTIHNLPDVDAVNQFFNESIQHFQQHGHPTPLTTYSPIPQNLTKP